MKKLTILMTICAITCCIFLSGQTHAQTPLYKPGSVWRVSFIKTKANMTTEYLNSLKANWKAIHDEAIAQGLIMSYKILDGAAANPEDFDVMLLVESKNMASLEGNDEKWEAARKKVMGEKADDAMKTVNQSRIDVREIYGSKLMREVVYK